LEGSASLPTEKIRVLLRGRTNVAMPKSEEKDDGELRMRAHLQANVNSDLVEVPCGRRRFRYRDSITRERVTEIIIILRANEGRVVNTLSNAGSERFHTEGREKDSGVLEVCYDEGRS